MEAFVRQSSVAVAMPQINIDTDQVLPARFMKQPRTPPEGYAPYLFHDLRRSPAGSPSADFALNDPANARAKFIAARRNFGSGSSREAAVYALVDAGIRCVVAPSHGDIFSANAVNNGLVPARVEEAAMEELLALLAPGGVVATVDLENCSVEVGGRVFGFQIDPVWRMRLLNGWDDIDITRRFGPQIDGWLAADAVGRPWAQLPPEPAG